MRTPIVILLSCAIASSAFATGSISPELLVDTATGHTSTPGGLLLRWPGELNRRYRIETSSDLAKWTSVSSVVGLDRTCVWLAKRAYVPPASDPTKTDPEVRKFWRVTPYDFDSNSNGLSDRAETETGADPFAGARITLRCHFVPFALCLSNSIWSMPTAEQISVCQAAGYTGMGLASFGSEGTLKAFADNTDVASGRFRIYSALWWTATTDTFNWTDIDKRLAQAARMRMAIWMVVAGTKSAADIETAYTNIKLAAQHCQKAGVPLVLYSHQGTTFVCAEEALTLLKRLNADTEVAAAVAANTSISIHLCHELKAGKGASIAAVVAKVAPYCTLASISGAESDTATRGNWDTGIMPLDQGSYDVRPFLQALATAGYTGPMEYHTYNLPDPRYNDHLVRTLLRWRQLVTTPTD